MSKVPPLPKGHHRLPAHNRMALQALHHHVHSMPKHLAHHPQAVRMRTMYHEQLAIIETLNKRAAEAQKYADSLPKRHLKINRS